MNELPDWDELTEWVDRRPFWGGVLMMLASGFIAWVPLNVSSIVFLGVFVGPVGYLFAGLLFASGLLALRRPDLHDVLGVSGVFFSLLSVFGALGGLFIGMLVGTIGGLLCYSWGPPGEGEREVTKDFEDI